jgi:L-threonylcarbamoyladenylate synthase
MRIRIDEGVELLKSGKVIGVPTETVYGLAASLYQPSAIENIFLIKGRPSNNPLIIHVDSAEKIEEYVLALPSDFIKLAQAFWPGPLTLVLPVIETSVPNIVRAGLSTAAFRIPNHLITRELLQKTGPLVMPSANISGRPSSTTADHVEQDFGKKFPVIDGGACQQGLESTILYFSDHQWQLIRLGALSPEAFLPVLGYHPKVIKPTKDQNPICPGQLFRHYAPKAKLHLCFDQKDCKDIVIGFSDRKYPLAKQVFVLGASDNANEVAENLYSILRQLDENNIDQVSVDMDFPSQDLWLTIKERFLKASNC